MQLISQIVVRGAAATSKPVIVIPAAVQSASLTSVSCILISFYRISHNKQDLVKKRLLFGVDLCMAY